MTDFDPKIAEFVQTGATASLLLDGMKLLVGECIEITMRRLVDEVISGGMTPDMAMGFVHEIAAYRRLLQRQQQKIRQGEKAREHTA